MLFDVLNSRTYIIDNMNLFPQSGTGITNCAVPDGTLSGVYPVK